VIGKVLRGGRPDGLIRYLYGPGRHEEHTDPHIVAGWRDPAGLEPPLRPDGRRDFRPLNGLLNQPHAALGLRGLEAVLELRQAQRSPPAPRPWTKSSARNARSPRNLNNCQPLKLTDIVDIWGL
jgi:hypothetical protein